MREYYAEHVNEGHENKQVRRPAMDRPDQPPEFDARHDEAHALEGFSNGRAIVEHQQDAGYDLDRNQEERDAAEVIPARGRVNRNCFVFDDFVNRAEVDPFAQPVRRLGSLSSD